MQKWSEIKGVVTFSRITKQKSGDYAIFVEENKKEKVITTFEGIQMGHAVCFHGNKTTQEVQYDASSRMLWISGTNMEKLKTLKPGESYPESKKKKDSATV